MQHNDLVTPSKRMLPLTLSLAAALFSGSGGAQTIKCGADSPYADKADGDTFIAHQHSYKIVNNTLIRNPIFLQELEDGFIRFCTSRVTDMNHLFESKIYFNQPIGDWDLSQVTNMEGMFLSAYTFNKPLNNWQTSRVTNMHRMFENAWTFNQKIENWDVGAVTTFDSMFKNAFSFDQPLNGWGEHMGQVETVSMIEMFLYAYKFNQDLADWQVGNVINMQAMFYQSVHFNGDISSWDTSHVTNMYKMFYRAVHFQQNLNAQVEDGKWQVGQVIDASSFADQSGLVKHPEYNPFNR